MTDIPMADAQISDIQLLEQFRKTGSHHAFALLMDRHLGWVYASARRRVRDEHLAHDVAQAVFLLLAQRAAHLRDLNRLGPWLLQTTTYASNHAIREEVRRRKREQRFACQRPEATSPERSVGLATDLVCVEAAVEKLNQSDRALILLRFYQGLSLAEVGTQLGISHDAARKRVDRVVQRLRERVTREGPTVNSVGSVLAAITAGGALPGIPLQTLTSIKGASSRAVSISKGVTHMLLRNKIKQAAVFASLSLLLGGGIVLAFHGPGGDEGAPPVTPPSATVIPAAAHRAVSNNRGAVIVSEDGTKLTGYSELTGKWAQLEGKDFSPERITAGGSILVYCDNERCCAFSPTLGTWSTLDLPKAADPKQPYLPSVTDKLAAVAVPGIVYAYAETTGKWEPLPVPGNSPAIVTINANLVTVEADGKLYFCDSTTGKWTPGF